MKAAVVTFLVFVASLVSSFIGAEEPSPTMMDFIRESGLLEQMEQQKEQELIVGRAQIETMMDRMLAQIEDVPQEVKVQFDSMANDMVVALENAFTVEELLAVYAEPFDRAYSGEELAQMIEELSTPEGIKMMKTVNEAGMAVQAFRAARQGAAMQVATQRIIGRVQALTGGGQ